jgi:Zn-dependent protease
MRSNQIGTFRGIPVRLNWGAVLLAIIFGVTVGTGALPALAPGGTDAAYLLGGLLSGAGLLASIFVHEAAHALVALRYGVPVSSITLWLLGGVAHLEKEAPNPGAEAKIAGAGPVSSLAVGALLLGAGFALFLVDIALVFAATLLWLGGLNAMLALFNLLPGAPLDGGRLLHAWLWQRRGSRARATEGAAKAGRFIGIAVAIVGLAQFIAGNIGGLWTTAIGWFLYTAAGQEAVNGKLTEALADRTVADIMAPLPPTVADWSRVSDLLERPQQQERILAVDFGGTPTILITFAELARAAAKQDVDDPRLRDLQFPKLITIPADSLAVDLLREQSRRFLATADGTPVGVVTTAEIDRAVFLHRQGSLDRHPDLPTPLVA